MASAVIRCRAPLTPCHSPLYRSQSQPSMVPQAFQDSEAQPWRQPLSELSETQLAQRCRTVVGMRTRAATVNFTGTILNVRSPQGCWFPFPSSKHPPRKQVRLGEKMQHGSTIRCMIIGRSTNDWIGHLPVKHFSMTHVKHFSVTNKVHASFFNNPPASLHLAFVLGAGPPDLSVFPPDFRLQALCVLALS